MAHGTKLASELPRRGPARWAVVAALVIGGLIAFALTALIALFAVTWIAS
jgi:hypothetical protein